MANQYDDSPLSPQEEQEYQEAKRFLEDLEAQKRQGERKELAGSALGSFVSGLGRGPTLDYPLLEAALTGKSLEELNKEIEAQREENPWSAGAGEFIGGMFTPGIPGLAVASKAVKAGKGLLGAATRGALTAGVTGGVQGFLYNPVTEGGDMMDRRLNRAAIGAAGGAALGGLGGIIAKRLGDRAAARMSEADARAFAEQLAREEAGASRVGQGGPGRMQAEEMYQTFSEPREGQFSARYSPPGRPLIEGIEPTEISTMRRRGPTPGEGPQAASGGPQPKPGPQGPGGAPKGAAQDIPTTGRTVEEPLVGAKETKKPTFEEELARLQEEAARASDLGDMPSSLEEIGKATKRGQEKLGVFGEDLPRQKELVSAVTRMPDLETKPLGLHYEMGSSPARAMEVKRMRQGPGPSAVAVSDYELQMKRELMQKQDDLAKQLGSSGSASDDAAREIDAFRKDYLDTRNRLSPAFEEAANTVEIGLLRGNSMKSRIADVINQGHEGLVKKVMTKIKGLDGRVYKKLDLELSDFSSFKGISREEYSLLESHIKDLNSKPTYRFRELQGFNESLRQGIDYTQVNKFKNVEKVRREIKDAMELAANDVGVKNVKDIFKQWAINEGNREALEDVIGGKILRSSASDASKMFTPENVAKSILRDSNSASEAVSLLGKEKVKAIIAGHIQDIARNTANKTGYSGAMLRKFFVKNQKSLAKIFDTPEFQRYQDINTILRLVPDEMPANVSDSGLTILDAIQKQGSITGGLTGYAKGMAQKMRDRAEAEKFFKETNAKWGPRIKKLQRDETLKRRKKLLEGSED